MQNRLWSGIINVWLVVACGGSCVVLDLIEISIVVLTFAAWFPIESAVSGFKGEQRP